jgi:transcription elongation GreA/GreB family factor
MNKPALVKKIIGELEKKIALYVGAANAAHAEATHEESKAEDKYDTRGLEASYLAAGQSRQMAETAAALQQFASLNLRKFSASDPVDLTALVELETKTETMRYFIGPAAGGTEIAIGKESVLVITPQSPLGQQLNGKKQGDRLKMKIGGVLNDYRIASVT